MRGKKTTSPKVDFFKLNTQPQGTTSNMHLPKNLGDNTSNTKLLQWLGGKSEGKGAAPTASTAPRHLPCPQGWERRERSTTCAATSLPTRPRERTRCSRLSNLPPPPPPGRGAISARKKACRGRSVRLKILVIRLFTKKRQCGETTEK